MQLGVRAGWVVGMNHENGAAVSSLSTDTQDDGLQRREVDLPAVVIHQFVRDETNVVEIGQKIKEWVAGCGHQHAIARVAQQAKYKRVGLAGAGGENKVIG